uniref:N/A n=1 Tax=Ganoderma boninense TaxID=34458 RepID=A0A5K1JRW9_9APHY|nr:N/A [Ganoderma boninense]
MNPYQNNPAYIQWQLDAIRAGPSHPPHPVHPAHAAQHVVPPPQPPRPPNDPFPFRELEASVVAALDKFGERSSTRMDRVEIAIGNLSKVTSEALQIANSTRQENKEALDKLQSLALKVAEVSLGKTNRLEVLLGDPDRQTAEADRPTLFGRIEQLERAILELSESIGDPDAARPVTVRHEAGVNTSPLLRPTADVGVDAIDLVSPIPHAEIGIQVDQPSRVEAGVEARQPTPETNTVRSQTTLVSSPFAAPAIQSRYRGSSFTAQPLVAASWGIQDEASGEQIPSPTVFVADVNAAASPIRAESSSSRSSSPIPSPPPCPLAITNASTTTGTISSTSRTQLSPQPSSIFDEQEILDTLDPMSQCYTSPYEPTSQSPPQSSPICAPLHLPHVYDIQSKFPPHTPPVRPLGRFPTQPSLGHQNRDHFVAPPPLPRGILAASGTAPPTQSSPLPKGFMRLNASSPSFTAASASGSNSALSSLSQLTPPLSPPPPQRDLSLSRPPSPLSDLSVHAPVQPQIPSPVLRSRSLSSMSSLSSIASTTARGNSIQQQQPRPKQTAKRGGKSASATVRVKQEREDGGSVAQPKKRRKTLATVAELQYEPDAGPSASASTRSGRGRARGRGRGRERGGARGTGRKVQQLVITPLKQEAESQPLPSEAKQRYEAPKIGVDCPWPSKVLGEETSRREFIQCDNCEGWYHFACVGIRPGDPRLDPDAAFLCPPCEHSDGVQRVAREQRREVRFQAAACVRPDCDYPGAAEDTNEYFVERVIGRRPFKPELDSDVRLPTEFMWLVKWDGTVGSMMHRYKADQATWGANEHLGDCAKFIEDFEQAAEIEGRDLRARDAIILLNEAAAAGWAQS